MVSETQLRQDGVIAEDKSQVGAGVSVYDAANGVVRHHVLAIPAKNAVSIAILALGGLVDWVTTVYPAELPVWLPYDFSWFAWLGTWLPIWWYWHGISILPAAERPKLWRRASFLLGMTVMYAVLQTHYLYLAEHQFFLNRIQHVVMHHLGPFLVALDRHGLTTAAGATYIFSTLNEAIDAVRAALGTRPHDLPGPAVVPSASGKTTR
ncbi:MAG: cytochrome c oxidase assembly protein [Acidobacteriaceae bacterium]|nr:cytochrome c oxidase assembly protein [Acidobacteriaceae bacterium]